VTLDLRAIAKVELHRHLEGSLRVASLLEVSREHGLPLPAATAEALAPLIEVRAPMRDLLAVLSAFEIFQRAFVSPAAVERFAFEAVEDAARENVQLLELRCSPDFMARPHGLDWDALMEALLRGSQRAAAQTGIALGLIAIVSRGYGLASAERTADFAIRWRHALVGFDLADDEVRFPSRLFAEPVRRVREAGLPVTVHTGEGTSPASVRDALDSLLPRRLGHGVAVAQDEALIERVLAAGIALEMCPTSNLRTRAVPSAAEHPARALLRRGLRVTISSDDPGLFGIDLTHELEVARRDLGFSDRDLALATKNALEASFLSSAVKADLGARFAWVEDALAESVT
jgi:adenosine deaminase